MQQINQVVMVLSYPPRPRAKRRTLVEEGKARQGIKHKAEKKKKMIENKIKNEIANIVRLTCNIVSVP